MLESLHFFPFVCSKRDLNIDLGYTLEVTSSHNHCLREEMRTKVYPSKSQFNYIKVELEGVLITWACYHHTVLIQHDN